MVSRPRTAYGRPHRRRRLELLAALVPGTPCAVCRRPMYPWQELEADHSKPWALGGTVADRLLHGRCNARRGAQLGNRLRGLAKSPKRRRSEVRRLPQW